MKIKSYEFDLKSMCKRSLPPTIISIILLPVLYNFFGIYDLLIAPYMALMYIRLKDYTDIDKGHIKPFFLHLVIGVFATIACMNSFTALFINLIGGALLTYLLTDEYNPSSYFPYLLAFVLLQLIPAPIDKLPLRLLAITFSYLVLYITLLITSPKLITSKVQLLINKGFLNVSEQFKALSEGKYIDFNKYKYELFSICRDMNRVIYLSQKSKYYPYVILFQHLNNITDEVHKRDCLLNKNKKYFNDISVLFSKMNSSLSAQDYNTAITLIDNFLQSNNFSNKDVNSYFLFLLNYTKSILSHFKKKKKERKNPLEKLNPFFIDFKKINHFRLSLNNFKVRFSIRMGLLLGFSFAFVKVFHFNKSYWIPMTIFLLAMPFYEDSKVKSVQRFKGTVVGIIISSILFFVFKSTISHIVIIGISTFLMYALADFTWLTTYVTCYAIGLSTLNEVSGDYKIIFLRLFYTSIAILIVLFANRFILRSKNYYEMETMIYKLISIDKDMINELREILNGHYNHKKIRELIYLSYLVSAKLQVHNNPSCDDNEITILKNFIFNNNKLTTLLSHESLLLTTYPEDALDKEFILNNIEKIETILNQMENSFKNHTSYNPIYSDNIIDSILTKNSYVNTQMFNCFIKAEDTLSTLSRLSKTLKRNH
ncbi:MAG: FUSC family protein [Clostridium sp.]